ncbi:MAG: hypothetical protein ACRD51_10335 [Candidatus Acidiferrum sp.]
MPVIKTFDEQLLLGITPGIWVAISKDQERIVGTGNSIEEANEKARENGERDAYIFRVPAENSALIV